jgi:hypothetical protein
MLSLPFPLATDQRIRVLASNHQRQEIDMSFRKVAFVAAAIALGSIGSANAGGPRAHKIDLGGVNGVAYYTEEAGRFRVVATLAQQEGLPIRVETVLAPGQSVVLSTANGETGLTSVELSRENNDLRVLPVAATN